MRKHLQSGKFNIVNVNLWVVVINVSTAITNSGKLPEGASPKSTVFRVGLIEVETVQSAVHKSK